MVQEVTFFQTTDGHCFQKKEDAERYENLYNRLSTIGLSENKPTSDIAIVYLQDDVDKIINNFFTIIEEEYKDDEWLLKDINACKAKNIDYTTFSETLSYNDNVDECVRDFWFRIRCINKNNYTEYNQPYYARHPDEYMGMYKKW